METNVFYFDIYSLTCIVNKMLLSIHVLFNYYYYIFFISDICLVRCTWPQSGRPMDFIDCCFGFFSFLIFGTLICFHVLTACCLFTVRYMLTAVIVIQFFCHISSAFFLTQSDFQRNPSIKKSYFEIFRIDNVSTENMILASGTRVRPNNSVK